MEAEEEKKMTAKREPLEASLRANWPTRARAKALTCKGHVARETETGGESGARASVSLHAAGGSP